AAHCPIDASVEMRVPKFITFSRAPEPPLDYPAPLPARARENNPFRPTSSTHRPQQPSWHPPTRNNRVGEPTAKEAQVDARTTPKSAASRRQEARNAVALTPSQPAIPRLVH